MKLHYQQDFRKKNWDVDVVIPKFAKNWDYVWMHWLLDNDVRIFRSPDAEIVLVGIAAEIKIPLVRKADFKSKFNVRLVPL